MTFLRLFSPYDQSQIKQMHQLYDSPKNIDLNTIGSMIGLNPERSDKDRQTCEAVRDRKSGRLADTAVDWIEVRHLFFPGCELGTWNKPGAIKFIYERPYPYACAKVDFLRSRELNPAIIRQAYQLIRTSYFEDKVEGYSRDSYEKDSYSKRQFYCQHPLEFFFVERVYAATFNAHDREFRKFVVDLPDEPRNRIYEKIASESDQSDGWAFIKNLGRYHSTHAFNRTVSHLDWALEKDLEGDAYKIHGFVNFDQERRQAWQAYEKRFLIRRVCLVALVTLVVTIPIAATMPQVWSHRKQIIARVFDLLKHIKFKLCRFEKT